VKYILLSSFCWIHLVLTVLSFITSVTGGAYWGLSVPAWTRKCFQLDSKLCYFHKSVF